MKMCNILLLLGMVSAAALAQPVSSAGQMHATTENGITYLCGGVGLDESTAMKQAAKDYDLMSTFAAQGGSYLADVKIELLGKDGAALLQTTCDGPILLLKLPRSGSYRMRAAVNGHAQTKAVSLGHGRGPRRLVFVWPAAQAGLEQSRSAARTE